MQPDQILKHHYPSHRRRSKRHVEDKLEALRSDERVEYIVPQHYLKRHKRKDLEELSDKEIEELIESIHDSVNIKSKLANNLYSQYGDDSDEIKQVYKYEKRKENAYSDIYDLSDEKELEKEIEALIDNTDLLELSQQVASNLDKRKKLLEQFLQHENEFKSKSQDFHNLSAANLPKEIDFNDHNYKQQWYLINNGQYKIPLTHDLNVKEAWLKGYTGKNVTIVIIDDGIDHEHPDFVGKYVINYKTWPKINNYFFHTVFYLYIQSILYC
jgi:subtilisin family serine protease